MSTNHRLTVGGFGDKNKMLFYQNWMVIKLTVSEVWANRLTVLQTSSNKPTEITPTTFHSCTMMLIHIRFSLCFHCSHPGLSDPVVECGSLLTCEAVQVTHSWSCDWSRKSLLLPLKTTDVETESSCCLTNDCSSSFLRTRWALKEQLRTTLKAFSMEKMFLLYWVQLNTAKDPGSPRGGDPRLMSRLSPTGSLKLMLNDSAGSKKNKCNRQNVHPITFLNRPLLFQHFLQIWCRNPEHK